MRTMLLGLSLHEIQHRYMHLYIVRMHILCKYFFWQDCCCCCCCMCVCVCVYVCVHVRARVCVCLSLYLPLSLRFPPQYS